MFKSRVPNSDVLTLFGWTLLEGGRRSVGWDQLPTSASPKGLKAGCPSSAPPGWKNGIVLVQNLIETRGRDQGVVLGGLHLAVTESEIITPCSIKQLVAPGTEGDEATNRSCCRRYGCRIRADEPGSHPI